MDAARSARPQAVLFACGLNSVRSPMAAGLFRHFFGRTYVGSAGVRKGELDPFAVAAMEELGLDIAKHKPMTFEELEEWEGLNFDLIVTLSPEAHHKALEPTWSIGRPPTQPRPRVRASSASMPIGRCATSSRGASGSASQRSRPETNRLAAGPVVNRP